MDKGATGSVHHTSPDCLLLLWPALSLVVSFLGCGGVVGSAPSQPPPNPVTISVGPSSISVLLGEPQIFTAIVANSTNTSVTWSVNGVPGGNTTVGTISTGGVYLAPANLPVPAAVTVQATSAADGTKDAAATVTVQSDISVSLSPQSMPVELGSTRAFAATVSSAGNPNRAINWVVLGSGCSGSACGVVNNSGDYSAPQILMAPPSTLVEAISVADPSKSGSAAVTITSSFSLTVSGPGSVNAGATANFLADVVPVANSNPSTSVSWSISGAGCGTGSCGTISASGLYIAPSIPPTPAAVLITATPVADASKATSVSVTILSTVFVAVLPATANVSLGATQAFQANVTGSKDATVTWDVGGVVGGNSTLGTIVNSQTDPNATVYTAPLNTPPGGSTTVRARSNADPNVSASTTIAFNSFINVALTPANATRALSHRQTFAIQVNNSANQNVSWQVNGIAGGSTSAGQICVAGSNPCEQISASNSPSVDYLAPPGVPSPNPAIVTATSQADNTKNSSASVTILPHISVSVLPGNPVVATNGQVSFTAMVAGTDNQQVTWTLAGAACSVAGACGSIDSFGLFVAPSSLPSPDLITVTATSAEDTTQSGMTAIAISLRPVIFSISPSSAYQGTAGGFTLELSGNNFAAANPGPSSTILVSGSPHDGSCVSTVECTTSLNASDLLIAGNLSVQVENPDGTLSNAITFVVTAPGSAADIIPLTPGAPTVGGKDIVVVELSTNGGSGASGNVSLNVASIGAYNLATSSCVLAGSTLVVLRPASGTTTADLCAFSVSGLDPSFIYSISGPASPDIVVINREPLGLGIVHLTLQVPATAATGPRTLFVQNPDGDQAAGTAVIEVR
jgi:hypothetical protein